MSVNYFAYGSNMLSERMLARIPAATVVGVARLPGWQLVWDKISRDGSGKANLRQAAGQEVWGVVYRIPALDIAKLDRIENGYQRIEVEVECDRHVKLTAFTYYSDQRNSNVLPFDWYKAFVIKGAEEHSLPADYINQLKQVQAQSDPHRSGAPS